MSLNLILRSLNSLLLLNSQMIFLNILHQVEMLDLHAENPLIDLSHG